MLQVGVFIYLFFSLFSGYSLTLCHFTQAMPLSKPDHSLPDAPNVLSLDFGFHPLSVLALSGFQSYFCEVQVFLPQQYPPPTPLSKLLFWIPSPLVHWKLTWLILLSPYLLSYLPLLSLSDYSGNHSDFLYWVCF